MHLLEILEQAAVQPGIQSKSSVPDWMLGTFRRRSISFANGLTDTDTEVYWLQSYNFSIDLRLPKPEQQLHALSIEMMDSDQLQTLVQYQGWFAQSCWDQHRRQLSWQDAISLQLHNQWPEPAILSRVGNCMMEFAPSNSYIEDWRLQNQQPGPLIGLRLLAEYNLITGQIQHQGGGLIINGGFAGLVLGRAPVMAQQLQLGTKCLPQLVQQHAHDLEFLTALFNFETSVATGSLEQGFHILMSTQPSRQQQALCPLDGFELLGNHKLRQKLLVNAQPCERIYCIDALETCVPYNPVTPSTLQAQQWYSAEHDWIDRYTQIAY